MALVITGPDTLRDVGRDVSEPVTRSFDRPPLGAFSLADTAGAIREPLRVQGAPWDVSAEGVAAAWSKTTATPFATPSPCGS